VKDGLAVGEIILKNDILFIEEPEHGGEWLWMWIKHPEVLSRFMGTIMPPESFRPPTEDRPGLFERIHTEGIINFCEAIGLEVVIISEMIIIHRMVTLRSKSFLNICLNYPEARSDV
jgi:hypothetical protein